MGATKQVGRSGIALRSGDTQILLDYGVLVSSREPGFPVHVPPRDIDAIVVTHAHLDHTGGVPLYHASKPMPVYGTPLTFDLSAVLIKDFINLSGYYLPYEFLELDAMLHHRRDVDYSSQVKVGNIGLRFLDAGHIPGSMQVLADIGAGKSLVYTGDINLTATRLLKTPPLEYGQPSAVIMECTYANEDHPPRAEVESEFVARLREVVERGGVALIPAFSVGRSQEVLCILEACNFEYPVFVDGMAREVNDVMLQHPSYFNDYDLLRRALDRAKWVSGWNERKIAISTPGVVVSPAGMLKGGAAAYYVERVAEKKQNAIFLVSFQVPGTPGKVLMEKKKIFVRGKSRPVKAEAERFELSSHAGRTELETLLRNLQGSPRIFLVHGSPENCESMVEWVKKETGLDAVAPEAGEVHRL
ncbi:MAG: MBL fold metallo-hydrolase [Candidatus Bathyarchaeia archaeon]